MIKKNPKKLHRPCSWFRLLSICLFSEIILSLCHSQFTEATGAVQQRTQTVVEVGMRKMRWKQFAERLELCPLLHLCTCEKAALLSLDFEACSITFQGSEVSDYCVQLCVRQLYFSELLADNRITVVMIECLCNVFFARLALLLQVIWLVKWQIENRCALFHHLSKNCRWRRRKGKAVCRCKSMKAFVLILEWLNMK